MSPIARRVVTVVFVVAGTVALLYGSTAPRPARTPEEQVQRVAEGIRCPTCEGESVAQSNAPASVAIRDEIARRLRYGDSPATIRGYVATRFGEDILLTPPRDGIGAVVWIVPVVAGLFTAVGVGVAIRRWRLPESTPSADDRRLVEQARAELPLDDRGSSGEGDVETAAGARPTMERR